MVWTLQVCVLVMVVHLSSQDMVTLAPSEVPVETTVTIQEPTERPVVKPSIRALHIISDIKYRYATTLVSSRVVNPSSQAGEASFSVTLPESAFISEFLMEVKGKVYKAYVKEKEEAKAVYNQAVQAGQFAGHVALDARDSNQFTVSVNIEAHGKVTFNLTYEQLLPRNLGVYSNVISMNPQQVVEDMLVKVNIEEPTNITTLEVPEIQVSNEALPDKEKQNTLAKIEEKSPKHKTVVWAPTPEQQKSQNDTGVNGQFIVRYDVDREGNPQQILVDEGYFVHFFAPENLPKLKKHVVFVLDYSGSMDGRKLEQLKDAMNKILSELESTDFFSIVIFHSYVQAWSPQKIYSAALEGLSSWEKERISPAHPSFKLDQQFVVEASSGNVDLARSFLGNYSDLGATNIMGGLRTGLELVKIGSEQWINHSDPPQPVLVFLTDGLPNVEEYDTDAIINKTKPLNTKECPIFSLAFGYGADLNFLRKLSLSNNGIARNIYEAADASDQLENFFKTISSPLLANVTFSYLPGQVDNSSNTRRIFPVFFKGSELVVAGKISKGTIKDKDTIGELRGITVTGLHTYPIVIDELKTQSVGHLEKTWAYLTIQQLLDKADSLDKSDEKNQTQEKALKLALQYSFVTPLTSLVVVKPNETESAVDTTQIKPGSDSSLYSSFASSGPFPPQPAAQYPVSNFLAPQASGFGPQVPIAGYYPPPMAPGAAGGFGGGSFSALSRPSFSQSSSNFESSDIHTTPITLHTTAFPIENKITLGEVKWLQVLTNSSSSENTTVSVLGHEYKLGMNKTDQSFGTCQVHNNLGECHHIQYCALDIFKDDVSKFIPYQCHIDGDFLGVCCPEGVN